MNTRNYMFLVSVLVLASACGTTKSEHTELVVTPQAKRAVESALQESESDAQTDGSASAEPAALAANDPDKVICRDEPPPSGTRLGKRRVCATRSEWDQLSEDARDDTRDIQDGAKFCTNSSSMSC